MTIASDVAEEQLQVHPHPSFNSLAWLYWYMTRAEDIRGLLGLRTVYGRLGGLTPSGFLIIQKGE